MHVLGIKPGISYILPTRQDLFKYSLISRCRVGRDYAALVAGNRVGQSAASPSRWAPSLGERLERTDTGCPNLTHRRKLLIALSAHNSRQTTVPDTPAPRATGCQLIEWPLLAWESWHMGPLAWSERSPLSQAPGQGTIYTGLSDSGNTTSPTCSKNKE